MSVVYKHLYSVVHEGYLPLMCIRTLSSNNASIFSQTQVLIGVLGGAGAALSQHRFFLL